MTIKENMLAFGRGMNGAVPSKGRVAAKGGLAINFLNFAAENYVTFSWLRGNSLVKDHVSILEKAAQDVVKGLNTPESLIPEKYHNIESLSAITNVVLSGVNTTNDPEIYNIGMKIYNNISSPKFKVIPQSDKSPDSDNTRVDNSSLEQIIK